MEMSSSYVIPAAPDVTWRALNDPEILKGCIAGCETIEKTSDEEFRLSVTAKIGPVSAKFKGKMTLSNIVPPSSYSLFFEGQGGVAGFAKGKADVKLDPEGTGTRLTYSVSAQVGGKLAQVGSRLIDSAAKRSAEDFFKALVTHLGGSTELDTSSPPTSEPIKEPAVLGRYVGWGIAALIIALTAYVWVHY